MKYFRHVQYIWPVRLFLKWHDYWKEEGKKAFEDYLERTGRIQKMES